MLVINTRGGIFVNILGRFVLSIYSFCLAVISLFVALILLNIVPYNVISTYADLIAKNSDYSKIAFATVILFFIVSLGFLFSGTSKSKDKSAIEKKSQLGTIMISLNSIESIILSAVKQMDGVMDVKVSLNNNKDSVEIKINAVVTPERSIPELSAIMQARTKEAVESIAGVTVSTVEVFVEDVVQTIKPSIKNRVE